MKQIAKLRPGMRTLMVQREGKGHLHFQRKSVKFEETIEKVRGTVTFLAMLDDRSYMRPAADILVDDHDTAGLSCRVLCSAIDSQLDFGQVTLLAQCAGFFTGG